jgi:hypothetical protein
VKMERTCDYFVEGDSLAKFRASEPITDRAKSSLAWWPLFLQSGGKLGLYHEGYNSSMQMENK